MIFFSACPKCQGDVQLSHDSFGSFLSCLQCGLMRDVKSKQEPEAKRKYVAPAWSEDKEQMPLAA